MSDWYLYLIRCRDDTLYTGITTDVKKRFDKHQNNRGAKYLRGRGPLALVFSTRIGNRSLATKLEYLVKQLNRQQKETLIDGSISINELFDESQSDHSTIGE